MFPKAKSMTGVKS